MDYSKHTLSHELGHLIAGYVEEYNLGKYLVQSLRIKNTNVIGEDGTKHFPKCCRWTCCKLFNTLHWENRLFCTAPGGYSENPSICTDVLGPASYYGTFCGYPNECGGMPYKDKEGNQPSDESYAGDIFSVMGNGYNDNGIFIYPQNSKCPLKNC